MHIYFTDLWCQIVLELFQKKGNLNSFVYDKFGIKLRRSNLFLSNCESVISTATKFGLLKL